MPLVLHGKYVTEDFRQEEYLVGIISREEDIVYHDMAIADRLRMPVENGSDLLEYARQYMNRLVFSTDLTFY